MYFNMTKAKAEDEYIKAFKLAKRDFENRISKGQEGNIAALENILENINIVKEEYLKLIEIPLNKIKGTYYHSRSLSFSSNFFPLFDYKTEFSNKWIDLFVAQNNEGIRDEIEVYEYLNWFYVVEGNKRVSVMKYLNAFSILGNIKRLIPKYDKNNPEICVYYEFLDFYKKTNINVIWFKEEGKFQELYELINNYDDDSDKKYKNMINSFYLPFRKYYHNFGGRKLSITTGEAFLEYLKLYNFSGEYNEKELKTNIKKIIRELEKDENIPIKKTWAWSGLFASDKKVKVAFVYNTGMKDSAWTFSHEIGRRYIQKKYNEYVETTYFQNVTDKDNFKALTEKLEKEDYKAVFSTSFDYINKENVGKFQNVKLTHFSGYNAPEDINAYFGRMYEPRFLCGIIAGATTKTNNIGFVAPFGIPEVKMSINAFALGAKAVNPEAQIFISWSNNWRNKNVERECAEYLIHRINVDVITHHQDTAEVVKTAEKNNIYSIGYHYDMRQYAPKKYLTSAIWNWSTYYENIIVHILKNTGFSLIPTFSFFESDNETERFWGGINTGIVDIATLRENINPHLKNIINSLRESLITKKFSPFIGPLYSKNGDLKLHINEEINDKDLVNMDWFVDNVFFD